LVVISRRVVLLAILCITLLSVALRYPLVEHERYQSDSYFIHILSASIQREGRAIWTFHSLSYLGYYPLSYPTGAPIVLAEFSILSGLSIETSVLVEDFLLSMIFVFAVFGLCREFIRRMEFVLLATLLSTLGSRFIDTTYWDASARGLLVVVMMLTVFVTYRAAHVNSKRLYIFAFLLAFTSFTVHHMAVLFVLLVLAYVLDVGCTQFILRRVEKWKAAAASSYLIMVGVVVSVVSFGYFSTFSEIVEAGFQESSLFHIEPAVLSTLLNIAASYTNQIGFVFPLAILGIAFVVLGSRYSRTSLFPITLLLLFVPIIGIGLYVSMVLTPFVSILFVRWLSSMRRRSRRSRKLVLAVCLLLVVSSVALPVWSVNRWNGTPQRTGDTVVVDDQVFNDAAYLRVDGGGWTAITNTDVTSLRLWALSGTIFLRSEMLSVLSGDVTAEDVRNNVTWSDRPFPKNLYSWFGYSHELNVDYYVIGLMIRGVQFAYGTNDQTELGYEYFSAHTRLVVVMDNDWPDNFVWLWATHKAPFLGELRKAEWTLGSGATQSVYEFPSYMTYQSEGVTMFLIQLPL